MTCNPGLSLIPALGLPRSAGGRDAAEGERLILLGAAGDMFKYAAWQMQPRHPAQVRNRQRFRAKRFDAHHSRRHRVERRFADTARFMRDGRLAGHHDAVELRSPEAYQKIIAAYFGPAEAVAAH